MQASCCSCNHASIGVVQCQAQHEGCLAVAGQVPPQVLPCHILCLRSSSDRQSASQCLIPITVYATPVRASAVRALCLHPPARSSITLQVAMRLCVSFRITIKSNAESRRATAGCMPHSLSDLCALAQAPTICMQSAASKLPEAHLLLCL